MTQSRLHSAIETAANIAIGYSVNFVANLVILPAFGYHVSVRDNVAIGVIYTVVSVVRSYALRRLFNAFHRVKS
jgi:hypothetical protein